MPFVWFSLLSLRTFFYIIFCSLISNLLLCLDLLFFLPLSLSELRLRVTTFFSLPSHNVCMRVSVCVWL